MTVEAQNRLGDETSAYLRQHRHNPVAWWPWGAEPFERARRLGRPVLVSIGYSSCHWCHVMERESFEDGAIAELMNRELICIKVDREERPDVDQIYMDAVVRLTGQGGWPLNVFCLPDGRPFFGGTYFPPQRAYGRPSWPDVVSAVSRLYREQADRVVMQAEQVMAALRQWPELEAAPPGGVEGLRALCEQLMTGADEQHGGFGAAPKFPMPPTLLAVLHSASLGVASPQAFAHLRFSLVCMARGGLYDQLGGGFHRYSTDAEWRVPHFEKMLYDNGQLLRVYAEAYRQAPDPELAWPVAETIAYLEREMRAPEGGFYASQDADSEGEEGRFYVWEASEVKQLLGDALGEQVCEAYGIAPNGNFEHTGKSVLQHLGRGDRARFADARAKLLAARSKRVAPETDTKQVAAWIGYAISGLATAAATWHRADWLVLAEQAADFVWTHMGESEGRLLRVWDGERAKIPAFLDDFAGMLGARLDLLRATGSARHAQAALRLAEQICDGFYAPELRDLYFARPGDDSLVYRPQTDSDGATPSSAGLAVLGLVRIAQLSGNERIREIAHAVLERYGPLMARAPQALPTLVRASAIEDAGLGVGLIVGDPDAPQTQALAHRARELLSCDDLVVIVRPGERPEWLAAEWLEGREHAQVPTAYVCRGHTCSLPATRPEDLLA